MWAIDAAEDSSLQADVFAFDLSDKFFPPAAWIPKNMELKVHDILEPFSSDIVGTLDVVHFRLFLMLGEDILGKMIDNAVTLLSTWYTPNCLCLQ